MRRPLLTLLPALLLAGASACGGTAPDGSVSSPAGVAATHGDSLSGRALAAILGCGACHPGAPAPRGGAAAAPSLSGLSERWAPADLASWLADPVPLREGVIARMPDFHLEPAEAAAATMHLLRESGSRRARAAIARLGEEHPGATAERGAAIVHALNCAGCHAGSGAEAWAPGPPLPLARVNLGVALQEAGRPADAAAMLREAIEREPFEPLGYFSSATSSSAPAAPTRRRSTTSGPSSWIPRSIAAGSISPARGSSRAATRTRFPPPAALLSSHRPTRAPGRWSPTLSG